MKKVSILKHNLMRAAMTLALMVTCATAWAQNPNLAEYEFTTGQDASKWITLSGNAIQMIGSGEDDANSSKTNIGFDFPFGNGTYSQFWTSSNGILSFNSWQTASWALQFSWGGYKLNQPKICGISTREMSTGDNGYVKYELTGTAPNRVLVCEFFLYDRGGTNTQVAANIKWQVQLHEADAKVVMVYGDTLNTDTDLDSFQIGLSQSESDIWTINPSTHEAIHSTGVVETAYNSWPGVYRYYEFNPPVPFTDNGDGTYTIGTATGWGVFCDLLQNNDKGYFSGKTVYLAHNIEVSRMAGSAYHDFTGTFDGQGKTLTFTYSATEAYAAPFRYVEGPSATVHAAIQNLNVISTVTGTNCRHLSGLIGLSGSYVDVSNCNVEVNITSNKNADDNDMYPSGLVGKCTGPGMTISGCTVTGEIATNAKYAAGLIGLVRSTSSHPVSATITNCVSSVTINSSTAGDGTHGGFVGVAYDGSTTITGCLFNGKLLTVGETATTYCGGFVGWRYTSDLTINNCLYAPAAIVDGETEVQAGTGDDPSATFSRHWSGTPTNSYYTRTLGTPQGKQAYSITAGDYVTVANAGTATTYATSGITSYGTGIKYNDVLYAGSGDAVSLSLSHSGYTFNGYTVDYGELTGNDTDGYTLIMPDNDVMITPECGAITTLPWSENFDAYTGSTGFTTPTGYPDVELPVCWQFLNRSETSSTYPQAFLTSSPTYAVSGNCLFFKSSSDTPLYAVLPEFWDGIANLMLTFTYRNDGGISDGTLIVGYMTDPADAYTFTEVLTCDQTNTKTEKEVLFADAPAGSYIAFKYEGGSSNNFYLGIDNVSVNYPPTCMKPTALTFVSSTPTSTTLGWTVGGTETAWQIAYSTDPAFDPDEVTPVDVTQNPATIDGLTASTEYYAYVRANCGNGDYSEWSYYYCRFATQCGVVVVDANHPFTEGFEGEDFPPYCWENIASGTTNQWTKGYYNHTEGGPGSAYSGYYGNVYLVMPDIQLPSNGTAQLTFWSFNMYPSYYNVYGNNAVVLLDGEEEIEELWSPETVTQSWVETTIDLTDYMGQTISLAFKYEGNSGHSWYVDDVEVTATASIFNKDIAAHGEGNGGWYLIASPLDSEVEVDEVEHLQDNVFDLYYFDQSREKEWVNYKDNESHTNVDPGFNLVSGKGYLYANSEDVTLTFTGTPYDGEGEVILAYSEDNADPNMWGWNLVGNPFAEDAYIVGKPFYTLNEERTGLIAEPTTGVIHAMEGVFVYAEENGETLTFSTEEPQGNGDALTLNVSKGRSVIDRAIVNFGHPSTLRQAQGSGTGQTLPKFQLDPNSTKVYIPQDGKDYAIVSVGNMGEVPVNFKANENGTYTLTVSPTLNSQLSTLNYLHLIDNMTGADVDLLATQTYTFSAKTTDYESRFKLVFCASTADEGICEPSFAFFSNGNWIISNEGEATLQVIDITGRILSSETINGSVSKAINAVPGVYMIRLINGENVKVQKIVVR